MRTPLLIDTNGYYTYTSGTLTPFSRAVNVDSQGLVTVTMTWQEGSAPMTMAVKDQLTNWR